MHLSQPVLGKLERFCQRALGLHHGADVGPLIQICLYYTTFVALLIPGVIENRIGRAALLILLTLLNFALTIGVMHMHAHRQLFRYASLNRLLEILLCFPAVLTAAEMYVFHVLNHHSHENDSQDASTTFGQERGWRAVRYWLVYWYRVKSYTFRTLFSKGRGKMQAHHRRWLVFDTVLVVPIIWLLTYTLGTRMLYCWWLPFGITLLSSGYFAWLTHAPSSANGAAKDAVNTVSNYLNVFIFNQGYHTVHHRHPGIHWTDIPAKLDEMLEADERFIVPYWVLLFSAWRVLRPLRFADAPFGAQWKQRYMARRDSVGVRSRILPYYGWI